MRKQKTKKYAIILLSYILFLCLLGVITYKVMNSRNFQFFGGIINRIDTNDKVVALTFDDGPSEKVDEILSILNSHEVKATFFLVGNEIKQYPEETRKLINAGHEIGNHTYLHSKMIFKTPEMIKSEIERTDKLIKEMGYDGPIHMRPPFGKKLIILPYYLMKNNRKTILWDIEPNSYPEINSSTDKIVQYVVDNTKPGSIILLHPWYDEKDITIGAINGIIEGLRNKGYEFATISELLTHSGENE